MNVTQFECEGDYELGRVSSASPKMLMCLAECCTTVMELCDAHSLEAALDREVISRMIIDTCLLKRLTVSLMINLKVSISV